MSVPRQRKAANKSDSPVGEELEGKSAKKYSLYETEDGMFRGSYSEVVEYERVHIARKSVFERVAMINVTESDHFNGVVTVAACIVCITLCAELWSSTAYGKFGKTASLATVDPRFGWWLMELPVTLTFLYFFFFKGGPQSQKLVPRICAANFCFHYSYRGWLFPFLIRSHASSKFSLVPALFGSLVTVTHGYLNAKWLSTHGTHLADTRNWLRNPRFLGGAALYVGGFSLLVWHDHILRTLRDPNDPPDAPRYAIPHGGLFEYATCPQYLCELITFTGMALLSCGPNGAFIVAISVVNLVPRAVQTSQWYHENFGDAYPAERKHLVPFLF